MFGFLSRLFRSEPEPPTCTIVGYWCHTPIKLDKRAATPLGGRVVMVQVTVDVTYRIIGNDIALRGVRLSNAESTNVAAVRRGEAWHADFVCEEEFLAQAVLMDLNSQNDYLRRAMFARWRETYGSPR